MTATRNRREPGIVSLLAEILTGSPRLDGAACVGSESLFDPKAPDEDAADATYRHEAAEALCHRCPAFEACREWADTQPASRAVLAGRTPDSRHPGRPRKDDVA